jgi:hypothetical protein
MTTTEQPQQSQSALDLWNEQVQQLAAPEHAEEAINAIYQNLMGLHGKLAESGNAKAAAKVEEAYNMAVAIYNMTGQQNVVIAGGAAAITVAGQQRDQAVTELRQLLTAIDNLDRDHPKLSEYAEAFEEYAMETASDQITESVEESIAEEWDVDFEHATAIWLSVLGRNDLSDEQKKLFRAFIDTLVEEDEWSDEDPDADGDE